MNAGTEFAGSVAPAKINLQLFVGPRGADGFHEVATLMLAVEPCDQLEVQLLEAGAAARDTLEIAGQATSDIPADADNLAMRGARAALEAAGCEDAHVRLRLEKAIPSQAGLGGGSSDAAAAAAAVEALLAAAGATLDAGRLDASLAELGSDVAFFRAARRTGYGICTGRGERVQPLAAPPGCWCLALFTPDVGAGTADVYAHAEPRAELPALSIELLELRLDEARALLANDLEPAALRAVPELGRWRELLNANGLEHARLSGSGSSWFALYRDAAAARADVARIKAAAANAGLGLRLASTARLAYFTSDTFLRSDQCDPGQRDSGQHDSGQRDPGQLEPGQLEPGQLEPGQLEPGQLEPGQSSRTKLAHSVSDAFLRSDQREPGQSSRPGLARSVFDTLLRSDQHEPGRTGEPVPAHFGSDTLRRPDQRDAGPEGQPLQGTIGVVGLGAVGSRLLTWLRASGYEVLAWNRNFERARSTVARVAEGSDCIEGGRVEALDSLEQLVERSDGILISVADSALDEMATRLAGLSRSKATSGDSMFALHTCGGRGPDALGSLATLDWSVGVLHPLISIPTADIDSDSTQAPCFAVTAAGAAREFALEFGLRTHANVLELPEHAAPGYHAAAALVAGGAVALLDAAAAILRANGIDPAAARVGLASLLASVAGNASQLPLDAALTGPAARGDATLLKSHAQALSERPQDLALYRELVRRMARIAGQTAATTARLLEALEPESDAQ